jgi:hypothetical protein
VTPLYSLQRRHDDDEGDLVGDHVPQRPRRHAAQLGERGWRTLRVQRSVPDAMAERRTSGMAIAATPSVVPRPSRSTRRGVESVGGERAAVAADHQVPPQWRRRW